MSVGGSSYQEQLAALRRTYVVDARSDGDELGAILAGAPDGVTCGAWEEADGKRFRKLAHDLRGTGGAYGYDDISTTAAVLEDAYLADADAATLGAALAKLIAALDAAVAQEDSNP